VIAEPGGNTVAPDGHLRASHADREQVIGTLKVAFVQGRLNADELDARVDQVFAARTYAELAEVTADIPAGLTRTRPPRDPWRATKVAWGIVYALIVPGLVTVAALPGGPGPITAGEVAVYFVVICVFFWLLGLFVMAAARRAKRLAGQPPRSAPGADR